MAPREREETVGERIRRLRVDQGLTQAQVGEPRLTMAYVSMIETGKRTPSSAAVAHIAARLGLQPDELLTGRPPGKEAELEITLKEARQSIDRGDLDGARDLVKKVLQEAGAFGLSRTVARSYEALGLISERTQTASEALRHFGRALDAWQEQPLHLRAETIAGIARCTQQLETPQMALHILDSYRQQLNAMGTSDPGALMRTLTAMIYPYFAAGVPEKAAEAAREAISLEAKVDEPEDLACMHMAVARSLAHQGHYGDALESLRKAEDIYLAGGWRNRAAKAQINEAIVLANKEDFESARERLTAALATLEESPSRLDEALALNELAHVSRKLDDVHGALTYLEKARPLLEDGDIIERAFHEREFGLCLGVDESKGAEDHLKKAIDLYRISGATSELATTFKELGRLYAAQGKTDEAMIAFEEGLAAVEERSA